MELLNQFLLRICFGLAAAMALTSPRQVTAGYFRNHSYVLLGLAALNVMLALSRPAEFALWPPLTAAILSYASAVAWLYEKLRAGIVLLIAIAAVTLMGAWLGTNWPETGGMAKVLWALDAPTSGAVLGATIAAMFLGHWYLNSPTMALAPLFRLVNLMMLAIVLRMLVCGAGLYLAINENGMPGGAQISYLLLRWLFGLFGALGTAWMTRETLNIPNTQSATGLLYVGVIATFLGEITALLLAAGSPAPL